MTSLCWPASVSVTTTQLLFSQSTLIRTKYYPTSTSCLFQQVLKILPRGVIKKFKRLICADCSSGREWGPGAMHGSAVCLVGCDEWVERMLICAWKASQLLTCWGSTPAADTGRHAPARGVVWWSGGGSVRHWRFGHEDTHRWWQTDPSLTSNHSRCTEAWTSRGYEPVNDPKMSFIRQQL